MEQDLDVEVDLVEKRCGGGGGTVDTMEGQDPTTVTLLHTNQSGALSLSMMMHFILKKGRVASFNVFHNKVQFANKRVILYGYVVISYKTSISGHYLIFSMSES